MKPHTSQPTVTLLLAVSALLMLAPAALAQNVVIKMATLVPQGSAWHTTLLELAQQWQQASGGKVTLRLYPGGVAGDDGDVVRKMRLGTLDAGLLAAAGLADIDRATLALAIPMAYNDYAELDAVQNMLSPELERIFADKGFVMLAWADAGWVHFFTKSPVKTPDDLKALKLFNWAGDTAAVEMWKAAGFNPVPLPSTEISTALQTGLVSALPTTPQAAVLLQWYNHAPYMTDVRWAVLLGGVVVTKKSWDKVPADLRPALLEASRKAGVKLRQQTRQAASVDVEAMAKRGLNVVHLDEAAVVPWLRAAEAAYPKMRESYLPAAAFDMAMKAREEYRRTGAAKGPR
jgi:TRAP-type C4-dicarboxylate transport system substrate-binding protein